MCGPYGNTAYVGCVLARWLELEGVPYKFLDLNKKSLEFGERLMSRIPLGPICVPQSPDEHMLDSAGRELPFLQFGFKH